MYMKYIFFCIFCRFHLLSAILSASEKEIIITHGTDTLIETGIWLQNQLNPVSNGVKGKNLKNVQFRKIFASKFFEITYVAKRKRRKILFQKNFDFYATDDTLFIALFFPLRWRENNNFDWIFFARKI